MEKDDVELIQSTLSGDEDAFSDLFRKYEKRIHAFVWRKIGDFHFAEEITQDAFLQAHNKLTSLENPNQFIGWLYVIADRLCTAWLRKKKMTIQSLETTSEEALEKTAYANYIAEQREATSAESRRDIVDSLLEMLPERERTVIILYYLGEMSCEAIGKFLSVSPNTVKSRLQRGRNRLRITVDIETLPDYLYQVRSSIIASENKNQSLPKGNKTMERNLTQEVMQWNLPEDAKARLGKGRIYEFQYSPDGAILAVASSIGIWLYDTSTYQEISLLTEHTSVVDCLAFSLDRRTFASGSKDGTILLWGYKPSDGSVSVQTKLTVDRRVLSGLNLAFSPDGKTLASGTGDTIQFWDTITGEQKSELTSFNTFLSFSPDGTTIIVCEDRKGTISLWNPITGKPDKTIPGHIDRIHSVALSPNGKTIAMGSENGPIHLYDLDTIENKITLSGHERQVQSLVFSSDGKMLVSGSLDQTVRLWDVNTGEHKQTMTGHTDWVQSVALSPNGKTIASGGGDDTIRFWDIDTGTPINIVTGHTPWIGAIAFSPHNKETITIENGDGTILFWHADTGQHIKTLNEFRDAVSSGAVRNIEFSPDGNILAWGDDGMRLWDEDTNEYKMILKISEWGTHSVALSPDGNIIAIAFDKGNLIKLCMPASEQELTLTGHTEGIFGLAFSPDSKTLASTSDDDTIRLWDAQTGKITEVFALDSTWRRDVVDWWKASAWWGLAFSPDGKTLAVGGGEIILLWDIDTGNTMMRLIMPSHRVFDLAFSPDGKTLASGGFESNINLWDPHTGKHKKTLTGHTDWVSAIVFSPDGKSLGSRGDDGTVLIWKVNPYVHE